VAGFITSDPGSLSIRAQRFLSRCASRRSYGRGLTGGELRKRIQDVYGRPFDNIVTLLDQVQTRYGGLTYRSGFFDSTVLFSPSCEPDDPSDQLEILYAIQTGGPTGASLYADGSVAIGLDQFEVREFPSLDSVIECDSMFDLVTNSEARQRYSFHVQTEFLDIISVLHSRGPFAVQEVREAAGERTRWFVGDSLWIYLTGAWSSLGLGVSSPVAKVWGSEPSIVDSVRELLS